VFEQMIHDLRVLLRISEGRAPDPSAAILDSRTVRSTPESGHRGGYDGHKGKKGSKVPFRYSSEGKSRTLYYSTNIRTVRELYPDRPRLQQVSDETRIVVSEPLVDLPGAWNEVPESSYGVVQEGDDELHPFVPGYSEVAG
jgi:hypothetical protein